MTATARAAATILVYVARYARVDDARSDYELMTRLYPGGIGRAYETTVVSGELDGKLKIATADRADRGRAWIALAEGNVVWDDAIDADPGSTIGPFWAGLSRADQHTIARMLRGCAAALIVFSEAELQDVLNTAARGSFGHFKKSGDHRDVIIRQTSCPFPD
jgi:hypothetical protein